MKDLHPDVLCLQEVCSCDMAQIEEELGMRGIFAPQIIWEGGTQYEIGIALFSRREIKHFEIQYYVNSPKVKSYTDPNDASRAIILADIQVGQSTIKVGTLHFTWSANGQNTDEQERDLNELLRIVSKYDNLLLCGDFNIPRGTRLYETLERTFKSWVPKSYRSSLDPELFRNREVELVVDHLLSTPSYECVNVELLTGLSDHRAIRANKVQLRDPIVAN